VMSLRRPSMSPWAKRWLAIRVASDYGIHLCM
jgi:hypothetical protein